LRAVYEAQLQRYEDKQERKAAASSAATRRQDRFCDGEIAPSPDDRTPPVRPMPTKAPPRRTQAPTSSAGTSRSAARRAHEAKFCKMSPEDQHFIANPQGPKADALMEGMSAQQKETMQALKNPEQVVVDELMQAKLLRAIYSERQLDEVMTDFWINHFNVFINKGADRYLLTSYERDAIRPHVLGKFEDLLVATAQEPGHDVLSR
jgi:uncharacterized protein (DUF1800 family)